MDDKPANIEQYKKWLRKNHQIEITDRIKNNYESAVDKMKQQFQKSAFWKQLGNNLREYNDEYFLDTEYQLLQDIKTTLFNHALLEECLCYITKVTFCQQSVFLSSIVLLYNGEVD